MDVRPCPPVRFDVFNQFLFDDYIRSHLSKERRWFRKHKDEVGSMFPHERALAFVKDIRKLGVAENGRTFLDQFRVLITEVPS
jgi:WASH complex subunit 7